MICEPLQCDIDPSPPDQTHQRDHAIEAHVGRHRLLDEECLDDGCGVGEPGGLDDDPVKLVAPLRLQRRGV